MSNEARRMIDRAACAMQPLAAVAAALLLVTTADAQDASCKAVFNAIRLQAKTPNHQYFTISGAEPDSGALTNEMINTGSARFILVNGKWQSEPESPREMLKREEKNFKLKFFPGVNGIFRQIKRLSHISLSSEWLHGDRLE